MNNAVPKVVFSIPEVVAALGISRAGLYRRIGDGTIRASKIGARTVVPADELRRFVAALPPATVRMPT